MIDVVFLLLVFFMLTSRFGMDMQMPLRAGGGTAAAYQGPPRLIHIGADSVTLNGRPVAVQGLPEALLPLMAKPTDAILLRAAAGVPMQQLVGVMAGLSQAGLTNLILLE